MNKTLKLKHQINFLLPKVNAMYSNKGLNNKKQDSIASSGILRSTALASEPIQIKSLQELWKYVYN